MASLSRMDMSGEWLLSNTTHSVPITITGDVVTALHAAGVIPDPFWGENELACRWICEEDWVLTRHFDVTDPRQDLVIYGLDCVAEIRVNGQRVLQSDSAFRTYRVDLAGVLRTGSNDIAITLFSPAKEGAKRQAAHPFFVPFTKNTPIHNGNFLRKPHCDFGWDWNAAFAPSGIWGEVYLQEQGPRFDNLVLSQVHSTGAARVTVRGRCSGDAGSVTLRLCGCQATAPLENGIFEVMVEVKDPALWWPAGHGPQTLHQLRLEAGEAEHAMKVGLRDIQHDTSGGGFGFVVNGRRVFAKGANWIPQDALPGNITPEATRDLLQSAVDANMNMLRVWGGGRYECDWFYDVCDELGLMIWQDAMFACSLYPCDELFLAEVDAELREQAARLSTHACLALWCGDNEMVGALTWYKESLKDRDRYLVAYDRLNRTVERAILETVPDTNWWPSSPSQGRLAFGDAWHDDSKGDMHMWSVWHEGRDFDHYREIAPRFCSEFGFQSYPSMDVVRRFADPKDFNIAAPVMEAHQKNAGGNARIAETMFRYFRFPVDFESFVYVSQVQQALAIKTAVTHWRALMPHCMGALYWQLNDTWPVCSWASLDHGGGWKLLHHAARRFFAPVSVVARPSGPEVELLVVNDGPQTVSLNVSARGFDTEGAVRPLLNTDLDVVAGTVRSLGSVSLAEAEILHFEWAGEGLTGADHFAPKPYKSYDLKPAGLRCEVSGHMVTLQSERPAFYVTVEAAGHVRLSDNGVLVLPDRPVTLTLTDPDALIVTRDLYSATYGDAEAR